MPRTERFAMPQFQTRVPERWRATPCGGAGDIAKASWRLGVETMIRRGLRLSFPAGWLLIVLWPLTPGCVQRTITVTSDPAGALVTLNDQEVGRTPVTVPFTFYGTYSVRLEAPSFDTIQASARAKPPWWEFPGLDLLAEAVPGAQSKINWHFEMTPAPDPSTIDVDALEARARHMQTQTRQSAPPPGSFPRATAPGSPPGSPPGSTPATTGSAP